MNSATPTPSDGLAGFRAHWREDMRAGFLVFLIALPLCLGISMASGFPPFAGVLTAILGGLVVSPIMGARMTIKGPAAGLIVIALGAVEELGHGNNALGYKLALAAIAIAGVIQVGFGLVRAGRLGDLFPSSAVHGMLAAIGIIIASKQIHVALGVRPTAKEPLGLIAEIPHSIAHMNEEIAIIGVGSLVILFVWPLLARRLSKVIPGQMVVVIAGILAGYAFDLAHEHRFSSLFGPQDVGPRFLVAVPESLLRVVTFPDFSRVASLTSIKYVIMFALVGSIESLASAKAIDTLDPYHRRSDLDRDLIATGIGNTLAGLLGGLPMISEIVRSSANVASGAKTRWANWHHGAMLITFVALLPGLVHRIPLAALAAMLIFTGYRLASPKEFAHALQIGPEQLATFLATVIATLAIDLLAGIAVGIVIKVVIHVVRGVPMRRLFSPSVVRVDGEHETTLTVHDAAVFTNWLGVSSQIASVPAGRKLVLDFADTVLVDHSVLERLEEIKRERSHEGGELVVVGLENHRSVTPHPLSARVRHRPALAQ
jgi:MFS superfamily sulfate permease-like transporter